VREKDYGDIIGRSRPPYTKHPPMAREARAAQFASFQALTGYEEATEETARLTDRKLELLESQRAVLDAKLSLMRDHLGDQVEIQVEYFVPDSRKEGGQYKNHLGVLRKIDSYERALVFQDGFKILIDDIYDLRGELFSSLEDSYL